MEKSKLLLLSLFVGIMLMIYSWFSSYPLSINSATDSIYNHVSALYWFSVPMVLVSLFLIAVTSKSNVVKWIMAVGIFIAMYSLSYFYYAMPGTDSSTVRGLTEYFVRTRNIDSSQLNHDYFQWPAFFILSEVATSISGIKLLNFEFLQYTVIGFLLATTLYVYASKVFNKGGFLAVAAFPIVMFTYFNFQNVPFSLAFGLLFVLLMVEQMQSSPGLIVITTILFTGLSFMHAFVPLFFIIYLTIRFILSKSRQHGVLLLLTSTVYFLVQVTLASTNFAMNIISIMKTPSEYSRALSFAQPAPVFVDVLALWLSRAVIVVVGLLAVIGFIFLFAKRKLRDVDKAIFLTGAAYSATGVALYVLGTRALPLLFIPVSLGLAYLFEEKLRSQIKYLFLIVLCFSIFIPLNASFLDWHQPIMFQTKQAQLTANFMLTKYHAYSTSIILADTESKWYIEVQLDGTFRVDDELNSTLGSQSIQLYDFVLYSVDLARSFQRDNFSLENMSQLIMDRFNIVYTSGPSSYIAER